MKRKNGEYWDGMRSTNQIKFGKILQDAPIFAWDISVHCDQFVSA